MYYITKAKKMNTLHNGFCVSKKRSTPVLIFRGVLPKMKGWEKKFI